MEKRDVQNSRSAAKFDTASAWFSGGMRIDYNPTDKSFNSSPDSYKVFLRKEGEADNVVTFLPGYPDGSLGWSKVMPCLPKAKEMSKLFIDYLGMGDSDKPKNYVYSTSERADLVEALWRKLSIQSTTVVAFDFSSLVILEILQRRYENIANGKLPDGPRITGVFIFNGGLFVDGHSHPWYTTPILRRLSDEAAEKVGRSFTVFKTIMKMTMWSRTYKVTDAEVREFYNTMDCHDGLFYLAKAANFVADHKAQGQRLDFGHIFETNHHQIPFLIGGSDKDPFEHKQIRLVKKRLGAKPNLTIKTLPGGHLTTHEQPKALAELIIQFQTGILSRAKSITKKGGTRNQQK